MLTKQEIQECYNNLLIGLGGYIIDIYKKDYYEKENNNYINKGKMQIEKVKYIKDMFTYYIEFNHPNMSYVIVENIIMGRIYAYLYNTNITYEEKKIIANKFFNKIKEERIEELMILYKLRK